MRASPAKSFRMWSRLENRFQTISFFFLAMAALILILVSKKGSEIKIGGLVAIAAMVILTLVFPLAGMVLSIPIFLVLYFDNSPAIWDWWGKVKNTVVNVK